MLLRHAHQAECANIPAIAVRIAVTHQYPDRSVDGVAT